MIQKREEWKRLDFEGIRDGEIYEISNYGRIRYWLKEKKDWKIYNHTIIHGYPYFTFFKSKRGWKHPITKCLHKLVAEKFCDKPSEEHKFVTHLNFEKADNYYENLKWVTQEELRIHNRDNPYIKAARERAPMNDRNKKLTETEVIRLKLKLKRSKNPLYKIAKEFGISHTQLNRIRKGINWGHVKID